MNIDVNVQLSHMLASDIGRSGEESAIIDVIHSLNRSVTRNSLVNDIDEMFHITISEDRIREQIRRMINDGKIIENDNCLYLSPSTLATLNERIIENESIEMVAINQWIDKFSAINQEMQLDDNQHEALVELIKSFVSYFFLKHGASCYEFINGVKTHDLEKLDEVATIITSKIEKADSLYNIRDTITTFLPSIFSDMKTSQQEAFLLLQIRKAIHYLSMVVDIPTMDALMRSFDGVNVYLDTSILYRLLNLQGEQRYNAIKKLFDFCKNVNMNIKVFQCTVDELKRRIAYDSDVILKHPFPVSFASIGYRSRTDENYISTYWKARAQTGISAEDFNYQFSDILAVLDYAGIEIDNREWNDQDSVNMLRPKVRSYGQFADGDKKSENAVDHDAECLSHIAVLQQGNASSVIESNVFLLSTDWSLIRLQRYDHDFKNRTDMVVLPSQLVQLFCLATPKEDYFEAFLGLFSSSHIGFGTNQLNNEQVQEIMGRVAYYSDKPDFMQRVLFNKLIQTRFNEEESTEEKAAIVDEAIREEIENLETENEKISIMLKEAQVTVNETQANQRLIKEQSYEKEKELSELRAKIENEQQEKERLQLEHELEQNEYKHKSAQQEQEILELREFRNRIESGRYKRRIAFSYGFSFLAWILLAFSVCCIIIGVIPLIPSISNWSQGLFDCLFCFLNWQIETPITVAAYFIGIGGLAITFSIWLIKKLNKNRQQLRNILNEKTDK